MIRQLSEQAKRYIDSEQYDLAITLANQILSYDPVNPDGLEHLFFCYYNTQDYESALKVNDIFIKHYSNVSGNWVNRSCIMIGLKRHQEAIDYATKAVKLDPNNISVILNRGRIYSLTDNTLRAISDYEKVKQLNPKDIDTYYNLGIAYYELGSFDKALEQLKKGLELYPDSAHLYNIRSTINLLLGNFEHGFREYEARLVLSDKRSTPRPEMFHRPRWDGVSPLFGVKLLLATEQGYGDIIQFSRYIDILAEKTGAEIILAVEEYMAPLLKNIKGVSAIVNTEINQLDYDLYYPLMSLPMALKTRLDTIPQPTRLNLARNEDIASKWQDILGSKKNLRVGIACSGRPDHTYNRRRSIPLAEFVKGLPDGIEYIYLQPGLDQTEINEIKSHKKIRFVGEHIKDFIDTAELIHNVDLVVTIDTGVAHLSATLGKETWILLHRINDWRWLRQRTDSPWYPSVKLYRQEDRFNTTWKKTLSRVNKDLIDRINRI